MTFYNELDSWRLTRICKGSPNDDHDRKALLVASNRDKYDTTVDSRIMWPVT